jgi:hypothetical protein
MFDAPAGGYTGTVGRQAPQSRLLGTYPGRTQQGSPHMK